MRVRILSLDSMGIMSIARLIKSHLYLSMVGSTFGIGTCWAHADYSLRMFSTMSHHQLTPIFSYWFLPESQFRCTLKNVSINISLHPFLSCGINTKLYQRALHSREIRRSNRRVSHLSISYQLTAGFLFSYACFVNATSTHFILFVSSKSWNQQINQLKLTTTTFCKPLGVCPSKLSSSWQTYQHTSLSTLQQDMMPFYASHLQLTETSLNKNDNRFRLHYHHESPQLGFACCVSFCHRIWTAHAIELCSYVSCVSFQVQI